MIRINLLPVREERRKADVRQQLLLIAASVVVAAAAMALHHFTQRSRIESIRASMVQLEAQLAQYETQLAEVEEYRERKADIETKLGVIRGLERSRSGPVRMLDELARHAPDRLWLTELEASGGSVAIAGMSLDNERVARFLTDLEESEYFQKVELEQTEFQEVSGLKLARFRVSAAPEHPGEDEDEDGPADAAAAGAPPARTAAVQGGAR